MIQQILVLFKIRKLYRVFIWSFTNLILFSYFHSCLYLKVEPQENFIQVMIPLNTKQIILIKRCFRKEPSSKT